MNVSMLNRSLTWLLFALLCFRILMLLSVHQSDLSSVFDYPAAKFAYLHSQYNLDHAEFLGNIDDDTLYTYAGIEYWRGSDPASINPETPFLVKYLYGLSYLLFGNSLVIQFIFALLLLLATGLLTGHITGSLVLALLAALLLSLDPLFTDQAFRSLLDLPHALFIVLSFYFLVKYLHQSRHSFLIISAVFVGLVAVTKFYLSAVLLFLALASAIYRHRRAFLHLALVSLVVYLLVHLQFFYFHPHPLEFVNFHLDTLRLYRSYLPEYPWGEFLRIVFLGRWQTWWGQGIISVPEWTPLWPIVTLSLPVSVYFGRRHTAMLALCLFSCFYLAFNLTHVVFPRYFLSLLPLGIVSLLYSSQQVYYAYRNRRQRSQHQKKGRQ